MTRNALLAIVVVSVAAAAGVGWFFGSQIRSPAEVAAEAEPPEPSNITVEVVREELSADVITRGDIVFDDPVSLSLSGSFAQQPEQLVVTQAAEVDTELAEGDMAVEVAGRPVFLLTGEIPMYRDLRPGATGDDVLQLEEALARMGFLEEDPDDTWDETTGSAVAAWYEEAGYRPNGLSPEDEANLATARDRVRTAESALADAEAALEEAQEGPGQSAIVSAEAELEAARDAVELAEIDAARANEQAEEAVSEAEARVSEAEASLVRAEDELAVAREADPPLEAAEIEALEAAVAEAEAELEAATDAVDQAEFERERTATEQATRVDDAHRRVEVAEASLADARSGTDTSPLRRQVDSARTELTDARADLADLESELGTWLPAGEVIFLPRLPVRVDQVAASRGSVIEGNFLSVSGSELALRSAVPERDAPRVEEGMEAWIQNPETESEIPGEVSHKADEPGTNGVASDRVYLEILPAEVPEEIVGENVRVTIPVSSTGGAVLAVPAAALSATADGSTVVQVEGDDGEVSTVTVETGLAAEGLVEVTPVDGDLEEGDLVVVGLEQGTGEETESDEEP
ncbi:MAG: hypothetical protein ACLFWM_01025 [Actinomycetota bacterium]